MVTCSFAFRQVTLSTFVSVNPAELERWELSSDILVFHPGGVDDSHPFSWETGDKHQPYWLLWLGEGEGLLANTAVLINFDGKKKEINAYQVIHQKCTQT